jgi:transcriptional regulator with XRE-family HTH domain
MRTRAKRKERDLLVRLLREAREEADLRQCDLADRLNRSQSYISKVESGEVGIDVFELRNLCKAMGVCTVAFMTSLDAALN